MRRQPKGSSVGGQFAPDLRGATPPSAGVGVSAAVDVQDAPDSSDAAEGYGAAYEVFQRRNRKDIESELDARLADISQEVAGLEDEYRQSRMQSAEKWRLFEEAQQELAAHEESLQAEKDSIVEEANSHIEDARAVAFRLYSEAGVPEKYATFYANDVASKAKAGREAGTGQWGPYSARPVNPLKMLPKQRHPEKARAAIEAAKKDREWKASAKGVRDSLKKLDALDKTPEIQELRRKKSQASDEHFRSRAGQSEMQRSIEDLRAEAVDLEARKVGNVPLDAVKQSLNQGSLYRHSNAVPLVRNSDGQTNVWVRKKTGDGEISYDRVVGVTVYEEWRQKTNVLVTESGAEVHAVKHLFNGPGNGWNNNPTLVVSEPDADATPLSNEGEPTAGWVSFVDTTD